MITTWLHIFKVRFLNSSSLYRLALFRALSDQTVNRT